MPVSLDSILKGALWSLPGGLTGIVSVLLIWWEVQWLQRNWDGPGHRPSLQAVRCRCWRDYMVRLGLVTALLLCAASRGAGPLLWTFAAVMISRWAADPLLIRWRPPSHRQHVSHESKKE
jgi:hypothetical protein